MPDIKETELHGPKRGLGRALAIVWRVFVAAVAVCGPMGMAAAAAMVAVSGARGQDPWPYVHMLIMNTMLSALAIGNLVLQARANRAHRSLGTGKD